MKQKDTQSINDLSEYLERIASRITLLESQSGDVVRKVDADSSSLNRMSDDFNSSLGEVKSSIKLLNSQLALVMSQITILVKEFKNLAKTDQFDRLKNKIDDSNCANSIQYLFLMGN